VQYPKAGTTTRRRASASWPLRRPDDCAGAGDPRNNYLARMDWAANSTELAIQRSTAARR